MNIDEHDEEVDMEATKTEDAEELLATVDTNGMSVEQAEKILADPNCPQELKDRADAVLADADAFDMDESEAEELINEDTTTAERNVA